MEDIIFEVIEPAISAAPDLSIGVITMADIGQCPIPDGSTSGTTMLLDIFRKIFF